MSDLPLLIFPKAKVVSPPKGNGFSSKPHCPDKIRQIQRIDPLLKGIEKEFAADQAMLNTAIPDMEPELVLVIETIGRIEDFQRAVAKTPGLEWLAEWDDEFDPDEDFYELNTKGKKTDKQLGGRLFLSMGTQQGFNELLSLWRIWKRNNALPVGKGKWKEIFAQLREIRRWGIQEQLKDTGMLQTWQEDLEFYADESLNFQIEFFYRQDASKRKQIEIAITTLLNQLSGETISPFFTIKEISFHAVKVRLPRKSIQIIVDKINSNTLDIALLKLPGIMFFRPTGQALVSSPEETVPVLQAPDTPVSGDPVVAILDGVPFSQHVWLKNRLLVDDVDELETEYQPGERKHGTAMASLVIHGELDAGEEPLSRPVYFRPILQPDPHSAEPGHRNEHVAEDVFYEDRIHRAVRRMFEGEGEVDAQAPTVKIINLSFGDPGRPFIHTLSPCAKLLDWLSWKYKVLFCVSAGNFLGNINLDISDGFGGLDGSGKIGKTLKGIYQAAAERRLLSPAESINALTVGALHQDASTIENMARRVDILPDTQMPSPINRLGDGFRRAVKPEILLPGGRQLYNPPIQRSDHFFKLNGSILPPGQKVASEGTLGKESESSYTRGTSNATALASRAGGKIYEVIETLRHENPNAIQESQVAILIKALLVHGASRNYALPVLKQYLKTPQNSRQFKQFASKFTGYGSVDVNRVLACTEQRATVLGCGTIADKQVHEYRFPLPADLANRRDWRRLTITLAWFTPHDYPQVA